MRALASAVRRFRLPLLGGAIAAVLVLLMVTAIRAATTYYYTLPQFRAIGPSAVGRFVQVNGDVGGPVDWNSGAQHLAFRVVAAGSAIAAPLSVTYSGAEPASFATGISVVVAGRLQPNGTFAASQVLVKCPSHYTASAPGTGATWPAGTAGGAAGATGG